MNSTPSNFTNSGYPSQFSFSQDNFAASSPPQEQDDGMDLEKGTRDQQDHEDNFVISSFFQEQGDGIKDLSEKNTLDQQDDAMDIDQVDDQQGKETHSLLYAFFISQSEEEALQLLNNDSSLYLLFKNALLESPRDESIAAKMASLAIKRMQPNELPAWTSRFSQLQKPFSLAEMIEQGREDLIDQQTDMTAAEWLSVRVNLSDSLFHLAIQKGQLAIAKKLVEKCPAFLLTTNHQGKFALDALPYNRENQEFVEALIQPYGRETDLSASRLVWRQLAPLCYLENGTWAFRIADKHLLSPLDPSEIGQEPAHFHPLKVCETLQKNALASSLLSYVCSDSDLQQIWCYMADVHSLAPASPEDKSRAQNYHWINNHPVAKRMFYHQAQSIKVSKFTIALLCDQGKIELARQHCGGDLKTSLSAAPDSSYTEQLWQEHFKYSPGQEIAFITEFLGEDKKRSISKQGLEFLTKKIQQHLNEDNAHSCADFKVMLRIVLLARDVHLAQHVLSAFQNTSFFSDWLSLLIQALPSKMDQESMTWFKEVVKSAEHLSYPHVLDPVSLSSCLTFQRKSIFPLIIWLSEVYPLQFQTALHAKLEDKNTLFINCFQMCVQDSSPLSQELLAVCLKGIHWQRKEKISFSFGRSIQCSLRCYAFLYSDAKLLKLISEVGAWEVQEVKEILDLGKAFDNYHPFAAQELVALVVQIAKDHPNFLNADHLKLLVTILLKVKDEKEAPSVLEKLQPIFELQADNAPAIFPSFSDLNTLGLNYSLKLKDLQWFHQRGMRFPNFSEAEGTLRSLPTQLRAWWLQHVAQGIRISYKNKPNRRVLSKSDKDYIDDKVLKTMHQATLLSITSDARFKKQAKLTYHFAHDFYSYEIKTYDRYLELYLVNEDEGVFCERGVYTLQRLLFTLENIAQSRKEKGDLAELKVTNLDVLFADVSFQKISCLNGPVVNVTPTLFQKHLTPIVLQKTSEAIEAHYYDLSTGNLACHKFPLRMTCVTEACQFIEKHWIELNQKLAAIIALPLTHPGWFCFEIEDQRYAGTGSYILFNKNGSLVKLIWKYSANIEIAYTIKGIPSPTEVADILKKITEVKEQTLALSPAMLEIFGEYALCPNASLRATLKGLDQRDFKGVAWLRPDPLYNQFLVTQDLIMSRWLMIPTSLTEALDKGKSLRLIQENLSGFRLNDHLTQKLAWTQTQELIHDSPAAIDLHQLVKTLDNLKGTPFLEAYISRHANCSFEGMKANLERFLKDLANHNIQGFIPFAKYEKEYHKLNIQLTHTLRHLLETKQQETLHQFACELGDMTQFCGPRIAETSQFFYNVAFKLVQEEGALQGGMEHLLKKGYGRAALEVLEKLLNWTQDERAKKQTIHVLSYLRKTLSEEGYSLPPDQRVTGIQDQWAGSFGLNDFPKKHLPSWFEGILLPHFVEVLSDMQKEAREAKDNDLGALLINSVKEGVLAYAHQGEIVHRTEKLAEIESKKEEFLQHIQMIIQDLNHQKERLYQRFAADWRMYQTSLSHLDVLDKKMHACSCEMLDLQNEYEELEQMLALPEPAPTDSLKRKRSTFMASGTSMHTQQEMSAARLKIVGNEIKKLHNQHAHFLREQDTLKNLLEQVKKEKLKDIFTMEKEIQRVAEERKKAIAKFSSQKEEQLEEACEILGWIERDEYFIPSVSKQGLIMLLKQHKYFIPGQELQAQWDAQAHYYFAVNVEQENAPSAPGFPMETEETYFDSFFL